MDTNEKKDYNSTLAIGKKKATSIFQTFIKYIHEPDGQKLNYKKIALISIGILILVIRITNHFNSNPSLPPGYVLPDDVIVTRNGELWYEFDGSKDEYYKDKPDKDGFSPTYHISKIIAPDIYTKDQNTKPYQAKWTYEMQDGVANRVAKKYFLETEK